MARLKSFDKAIPYLNQVEEAIERAGDLDKTWSSSMLEEVSSVLDFCKREEAKKQEASLVSR